MKSRVTPDDIEKHSFRRATFGGYKPSEVSEYLADIAENLRRLDMHNQELEKRINEANEERKRLRYAEAALHKTLMQTQEANQLTVDQARKKADLMILEGKVRADTLLKEAKEQSKFMMRKAQQVAEDTLVEMKKQVLRMENDYRQVEKLKHETLQELSDFLKDTFQKVQKIAIKNDAHSVAQLIARTDELIEKNHKHVHYQIERINANEMPEDFVPEAYQRPGEAEKKQAEATAANTKQTQSKESHIANIKTEPEDIGRGGLVFDTAMFENL
ncbi:MAG: DivIVA domain-containing protein [Bernardetiaceae bacterium]|nr:DivIVA domain-containing protein [Bernardetiaceae bacterium]